VDNLFGYVYEPDALDLPNAPGPSRMLARKGRVAFSSARLAGGDATITKPVATVMMGARASFAPFYLRGAFKDYSHPGARLAGRKRYLPRYPTERLAGAGSEIIDRLDRQVAVIKAASGGKEVSEDVISRLQFLVPDSGHELRFRSHIRMFNVTAAEIGLILWVLTHGGVNATESWRPPSRRLRHMIGRAKPFGAGQMRVETARLAVEPNSGRSDMVRPPAPTEHAGSSGGYCPPETGTASTSSNYGGLNNASHAPFLAAFEDHVRRMDNARTTGIDEATWKSVIGEYLKSCDPVVGSALQDKGKLEYLPLRKQVGNYMANPYQLLRGMSKPRKDDSAPAGKDRLLDFE
jgi:hypothetical protein